MNKDMNKPETQPEKLEKKLNNLEKQLNRAENKKRKPENAETKVEKPERHLNINGGLRKFNVWLDEFILEAAKPFALLGFAMGTIDIFLRGDIATQPWFNVPWSIIQAVTIDGLFFSVWYKLFSTKWTRTTWFGNFGLFVIGLVLAGMVTITNGITSLQQLWNLPDSQAAMKRLGIPVIGFTLVRATLIVVVAVMIAFVYYRKHEANTESSAVQKSVQPGIRNVQTGIQPVQNGVQTGIPGMQSVQPGIPSEQSVIRTGISEVRTGNTEIRIEQTGVRDEQSVLQLVQPEIRDGNSEVRTEQPGNSVVIREVRNELPQLPPGKSERARLTKEGLLEMWVENGGKLNISQLAAEYGIAKTTLYGWLKEIKERACLVPNIEGKGHETETKAPGGRAHHPGMAYDL